MTEDEAYKWIELEQKRKEFRNMIGHCMCAQRSLENRCTPSTCFRLLYKELYPLGGYYPRIGKGEQYFLRAQVSVGKDKKKKEDLSEQRKAS